MVKLSDFGPQCLMSERKCAREEDPQKWYKRRLWTAPELLKMETTPRGLTKGTVKVRASLLELAIECGFVIDVAQQCEYGLLSGGLFTRNP